jgi:hypothetical protein
MALIAALAVVNVFCLVIVLLVYFVLAHSVRSDCDYDIAVKLFPPSIRVKLKR